jgi:hypothetical protein
MRRLLYILIVLALFSVGASAQIARVAANCTGTSSCTTTGNAVGDLEIAYAGINASATAPTTATGWTSVGTSTINGTSTADSAVRMACKVATGTSEASNTFTNATSLIIMVYRGQAAGTTATCASAILGTPVFTASTVNTTTTTETFGALTNADASSWDVGFGYCSACTAGIGTAPSGMANQNSITGPPGMGGHDTNAKAASFASANVTLTTAGRIITGTVEIKADTVATPTFGTNGGSFNNDSSTTISDSTASSVICYTTDGSTPAATTAGTCSTGTTYSGSISITVTGTVVKAIGTKSGMVNSALATSNAFTLTVGNVTDSPGTGSYTAAQSVTLSTTTTTGATIHYTTDNTTATCSSTTYSGAFTVNLASTNVRAVSCKTNYVTSAELNSLYTLNVQNYGRLMLVGIGAYPAAIIPTFVNETSKNSTLTGALSTNPTGQTFCASWSYCLPYADPVPSPGGNLGIIPYQYAKASTAATVTATDDGSGGSNTYTCLAGSAVSTSNKRTGICYTPNLKTGSHQVALLFNSTDCASGACTQVAAKASQFYNIATSSPVDTSGSAAGTTSTTANAVSITTGTSGDLIYVLVCRTGTPLSTTTGFAAGAGFTLGTTDYNDGCATEYGVQSSAGSITPTMTLTPTSTYSEYVVAFKAAAAGTAPTGEYVAHLMSWSSPFQAAQTYNFQFPSTGNLLFMSSTGSVNSATGITDANNTWISTGATSTNSAGSLTAQEFYVSGAATNTTGRIDAATTGTGDTGFMFYDVAGAPAAPVVARSPIPGNQLVAGATVTWSEPIGNAGYFASDGVSYGDFMPGPNVGMAFVVGGQMFNTTTGFNTPSTPCIFDAAGWGGMPLNGPEPVDQNNTWGHCYFTQGTQPVFAFNQSDATLRVQGFLGDIVGVWGSTGAGILHWTENQAGAGSSLAITIPPTTAGNLLSLAVINYSTGTQRTVSSVCLDGTTCAAGNAFTQFSSAASTGDTLHGATDIWYLLSAPSGKTTVTVTLSGSATSIFGSYDEVQKGSGSWTADGAAHTSGGAAVANTITGPAAGTTNSLFCTATVAINDSVTVNPKVGNEYVYSRVLYETSTNAATAVLPASASSHTPTWTDNTATDPFSASNGCFK